MNPRRIILVGPSGSGKTTVAQAVARALGVPLFSMDDFRMKGIRSSLITVEHKGRQVRTYEDPQLWDAHAILHKLRACYNAGVGFVAEGNHLLIYHQIAELPGTEKYYIDVPFSVSVARRKTRHRNSESDDSFKLIGEN